jgi:hypothetical protein
MLHHRRPSLLVSAHRCTSLSGSIADPGPGKIAPDPAGKRALSLLRRAE